MPIYYLRCGGSEFEIFTGLGPQHPDTAEEREGAVDRLRTMARTKLTAHPKRGFTATLRDISGSLVYSERFERVDGS